MNWLVLPNDIPNDSLADQKLDQEVHVSANQVVETAQNSNTGTLQYDLFVGTDGNLDATTLDTVMGQIVQFKISPKEDS